MNDKDDMTSSNDKGPEEKTIDQLDQILPIDDFEEEMSEGGKTVLKRGVFILPNLFTSAALFAGFYAIVSAMRGDFDNAAVAIFIAMVLDMLDGRIARLTNTQSKFGAEYDSLADMVSFGIAPALSVFSWSLSGLGKFGWAAAFIYIAGAALRLARFNTQAESTDKNYFTGLASPSAAAILAGAMWVCSDMGWYGNNLPKGLPVTIAILTMLVGILMVSNVRYSSFKGLSFKDRVPFVAIFLIIIGFAVVAIDPSLVLLCSFSIYVLSGPIMMLFKSRRIYNDKSMD